MIEPGARIWMSGSRYFQINGTLLANGTETDSIYFMKDPMRSEYGGKLSFQTLTLLQC